MAERRFVECSENYQWPVVIISVVLLKSGLIISIFYQEPIKKTSWAPDFIHCQLCSFCFLIIYALSSDDHKDETPSTG